MSSLSYTTDIFSQQSVCFLGGVFQWFLWLFYQEKQCVIFPHCSNLMRHRRKLGRVMFYSNTVFKELQICKIAENLKKKLVSVNNSLLSECSVIRIFFYQLHTVQLRRLPDLIKSSQNMSFVIKSLYFQERMLKKNFKCQMNNREVWFSYET